MLLIYSEETTADQIDSQKVTESGTDPNIRSDTTSAPTEVKSSMPDLIPGSLLYICRYIFNTVLYSGLNCMKFGSLIFIKSLLSAVT